MGSRRHCGKAAGASVHGSLKERLATGRSAHAAVPPRPLDGGGRGALLRPPPAACSPGPQDA
eukprot:8340012-Alexandrium_andersonii.AAC.1